MSRHAHRSTDADERQLIAEATQGNRVALERLLLSHYDRLAGHIAAKLPLRIRQIVSVEDVLQQTFLHAFCDIQGFETHTRASFYAWLRTIAENRLVDTIKALKRKKRGGDHERVGNAPAAQTSSVVDLVDMLAANGHSPSRSVARHEAAQAVHIGLAALPSDQRQALELCFIKGMSLAETATALGRSEGAVRGLVHRAKQNLRDGLGRSSRWFSRR